LRFTPLSSIPERFAPSVGAVYATLQSFERAAFKFRGPFA